MTRPQASRLRTPKGVRGTCVGKKIRFATRKAATEALARLVAADYPTHNETRVYACDRCAGWHLTSDPEHEFTDHRNQS